MFDTPIKKSENNIITKSAITATTTFSALKQSKFERNGARVMLRKIVVLTMLQLLILGVAAMAQSTPAADWKALDQALGRSGQVHGDAAYKFRLPRRAFHLTLVPH